MFEMPDPAGGAGWAAFDRIVTPIKLVVRSVAARINSFGDPPRDERAVLNEAVAICAYSDRISGGWKCINGDSKCT
jgi:hypothetical protein